MFRKSLIILLMLISSRIFVGAQWAQDFYKKISPKQKVGREKIK